VPEVGAYPNSLLVRASRATLGLLGVALVVALAIAGRSQQHALGDVPGRMIAQGIHPGALPYVGWNSEYPVVVGIVQWVASWFGRTPLGFLLVTSAFSAALALWLVALLVRRVGERVWYAICAPPFVLYALHNWDLLALVPAVAGVLAFEEGEDIGSGALIAIGACAKVFPAVFLPPLLARRVQARGWKGAVPLAASAAATVVVLNLPFRLASATGWSYPYRFQGRRAVTWGTLWSVAHRLPIVGGSLAVHAGRPANMLSGAALAIGIAALCVVAARRRLDAIAIAAAATGVFLLVNKVYSPNYDIWMVPWLALLPIGRRLRVAFGACSVSVFIVVFGYFHGAVGRSVVLATLPFLVVARAIVIALIVRVAVVTGAGTDRLTPKAARPI
jgi:uncharacterized membrane protein